MKSLDKNRMKFKLEAEREKRAKTIANASLKSIVVMVPELVWKRFKSVTALKGSTIKDALNDLIIQYLKEYEK